MCFLFQLHFQVEIAYLESSSYYDVLVYSMPPPESLDESKQESFFVSAKLTTGTTYIRSCKLAPHMGPSSSNHTAL